MNHSTVQYAIFLILILFSIEATAAEWFVAPDGSDANPGTMKKPLATVMAAQALAGNGDTVYLRGGTYYLDNSHVSKILEPRAIVNYMTRDGIRYLAWPGERPVFDFSNVKPSGHRVSAFWIEADDCVFKGFEIVGVQVVVTQAEAGNTQSTCFLINGGSRNRFENLSMHDGMGIGWYLIDGADNLVLNCDAYNNKGLDAASMGNVDGFGAHPRHTWGTGNVFRGCRAWFNSDDGFDLINADAAVLIEHCWSFYNGFDQDFNRLVDGHGFKAGGYGRNGKLDFPVPPPRHEVRFCLAVRNKTSGFYANHHTGGLDWISNTAVRNPVNFNMLSTLLDNSTDVSGYDHYMRNNLGALGTIEVANLNFEESDAGGNSFTLPVTVGEEDFASLDEALLMLPRQPDGSLPEIAFARLRAGSDLVDAGMETGFPFAGAAPDLGAFESCDEDLATLTGMELDPGRLELHWRAPAGWPCRVLGSSSPAGPFETWETLLTGTFDDAGLLLFNHPGAADGGAFFCRLLLR